MKVAVLFENLGPYHIARLNAMPTDLDVVSIERREKSIEYQWSNDLRPNCRNYQLLTNGETHCTWRVLRKRLKHCLNQEQPDMLFLNGWADPMSFAALSWSLLANRPTVIMSDSSVHDKPRTRLKESLKGSLIRLFDGYLAAGTSHVEYLCLLGVDPNDIAVGFDAVDNNYFRLKSDEAKEKSDQVRAELNLPSHYFLASARFVEKKNLFRLIEAYATYVKTSIEKSSEPRHLVIVGDGPLRSEIEDSIQKFSLSAWTRLAGFQQYDKIPSYYALADGFIHASTEEQWGLVINEAMACSLPIAVSNRCGCAPDLVLAGENGFLFDPYNVQSILDAITSLSTISKMKHESYGAKSYEIISQWGLNRFHDGVAKFTNRAKTEKVFKNSYQRRIASLLLNAP